MEKNKQKIKLLKKSREYINNKNNHKISKQIIKWIDQKRFGFDNVQLNEYVKPKFKELTQEQIDDIHSRGKITPMEMVEEMESMDFCAPGDTSGNRCRTFRTCHDCLVDYASQNDEYNSFFTEYSFNLQASSEQAPVLKKNLK